MKIIISKDPLTNKIDTKVDDVKEGQAIDLIEVAQWLSISLSVAINQAIQVRAKEQEANKIIEPNVIQINKFKN